MCSQAPGNDQNILRFIKFGGSKDDGATRILDGLRAARDQCLSILQYRHGFQQSANYSNCSCSSKPGRKDPRARRT